MPSITLSYSSSGPLLQVMIGVSEPHRDALKKLGKPVPMFVPGTFLVDTGASSTCVDPDLVSSLGLTATGAVMMETPSTAGVPVSCPLYDVAVVIPSGRATDSHFVIGALPIMETQLKAQGIDGLLGRDVLSECVLISNGPASQMVLSY